MKIKKNQVLKNNAIIPHNALMQALGEERATKIQDAQRIRGANIQCASFSTVAQDLLDIFSSKDSSGLNLAMEVALTVARKKPEAALAFLRDMIKEERANKTDNKQVFAPVIIQTPDSPEDIIRNVIDKALGPTSTSPTINLPDPIQEESNELEQLSERTTKLPFETEEIL